MMKSLIFLTLAQFLAHRKEVNGLTDASHMSDPILLITRPTIGPGFSSKGFFKESNDFSCNSNINGNNGEIARSHFSFSKNVAR